MIVGRRRHWCENGILFLKSFLKSVHQSTGQYFLHRHQFNVFADRFDRHKETATSERSCKFSKCVSELLVIDFLLNNGEDGACYGLAAPVQDQRRIPFKGVNTVGAS